jgi:hypothetical protein
LHKLTSSSQTESSPRLDDEIIDDIMQIFVEKNNPSLQQKYCSEANDVIIS